MKKLLYILLFFLNASIAFAQDPAPSSPTAISPNFTWYKKITGGDTAYYGYSDGKWSNFARRNWVQNFGDNRYSLTDFSNVSINAKIKNNANLLGQQYQVQRRSGFDATQFSVNNAPSYLALPDSLNQGVHPDIYYNPSGWNGYKFWMVFEPYENGNVNLENPYLVASNDGINFVQPAGITNPVFPFIPGTHNSDADIYEGLDGKLWMTNRRNSLTADTLLVKSSSNGITWSSETAIVKGAFAALLSPTTILENGIYRLWYVDNTTSPATFKFRTSSTPDGTYSAATTCSFTNFPPGYSLWHGDVIKNGEQYILLMGMNNNSLGSLYNTRLFVATSYDGIAWNMNPNYILGPKAGGWDNAKVYRSSAFIIDKGEERKLGMYYSAYDSLHAVHVGYTEITLGNNNIQNQNYYTQTGNYKISGHASSADVSVTGTGGLGYIDFPLQSGPPATSTSSVRLASGSINNVFRFHGQSGFELILNWNLFTAGHTFNFPNIAGGPTVATINGAQTFTSATLNPNIFHQSNAASTPTADSIVLRESLKDVTVAPNYFAPNLLTSYVSGPGTVSPTDVVLTALQKIDGNSQVNAANITTNTTNITTLQNSSPKIFAAVDLTAQTTVGTITSYTVPTTATYSVYYYCNITAIATNTMTVSLIYTDENNVSQTVTSATVGTAIHMSMTGGQLTPIRAKGGTTITVQTNNVATGGTNTFDAGARIVQL